MVNSTSAIGTSAIQSSAVPSITSQRSTQNVSSIDIKGLQKELEAEKKEQKDIISGEVNKIKDYVPFNIDIDRIIVDDAYTKKIEQSAGKYLKADIKVKDYINNKDYIVEKNQDGSLKKIEAKPRTAVVKRNDNIERKKEYIPLEIFFDNEGNVKRKIVRDDQTVYQDQDQKRREIYVKENIRYKDNTQFSGEVFIRKRTGGNIRDGIEWQIEKRRDIKQGKVKTYDLTGVSGSRTRALKVIKELGTDEKTIEGVIEETGNTGKITVEEVISNPNLLLQLEKKLIREGKLEPDANKIKQLISDTKNTGKISVSDVQKNTDLYIQLRRKELGAIVPEKDIINLKTIDGELVQERKKEGLTKAEQGVLATANIPFKEFAKFTPEKKEVALGVAKDIQLSRNKVRASKFETPQERLFDKIKEKQRQFQKKEDISKGKIFEDKEFGLLLNQDVDSVLNRNFGFKQASGTDKFFSRIERGTEVARIESKDKDRNLVSRGVSLVQVGVGKGISLLSEKGYEEVKEKRIGFQEDSEKGNIGKRVVSSIAFLGGVGTEAVSYASSGLIKETISTGKFIYDYQKKAFEESYKFGKNQLIELKNYGVQDFKRGFKILDKDFERGAEIIRQSPLKVFELGKESGKFIFKTTKEGAIIHKEVYEDVGGTKGLIKSSSTILADPTTIPLVGLGYRMARRSYEKDPAGFVIKVGGEALKLYAYGKVIKLGGKGIRFLKGSDETPPALTRFKNFLGRGDEEVKIIYKKGKFPKILQFKKAESRPRRLLKNLRLKNKRQTPKPPTVQRGRTPKKTLKQRKPTSLVQRSKESRNLAFDPKLSFQEGGRTIKTKDATYYFTPDTKEKIEIVRMGSSSKITEFKKGSQIAGKGSIEVTKKGELKKILFKGSDKTPFDINQLNILRKVDGKYIVDKKALRKMYPKGKGTQNLIKSFDKFNKGDLVTIVDKYGKKSTILDFKNSLGSNKLSKIIEVQKRVKSPSKLSNIGGKLNLLDDLSKGAIDKRQQSALEILKRQGLPEKTQAIKGFRSGKSTNKFFEKLQKLKEKRLSILAKQKADDVGKALVPKQSNVIVVDGRTSFIDLDDILEEARKNRFGDLSKILADDSKARFGDLSKVLSDAGKQRFGDLSKVLSDSSKARFGDLSKVLSDAGKKRFGRLSELLSRGKKKKLKFTFVEETVFVGRGTGTKISDRSARTLFGEVSKPTKEVIVKEFRGKFVTQAEKTRLITSESRRSLLGRLSQAGTNKVGIKVGDKFIIGTGILIGTGTKDLTKVDTNMLIGTSTDIDRDNLLGIKPATDLGIDSRIGLDVREDIGLDVGLRKDVALAQDSALALDTASVSITDTISIGGKESLKPRDKRPAPSKRFDRFRPSEPTRTTPPKDPFRETPPEEPTRKIRLKFKFGKKKDTQAYVTEVKHRGKFIRAKTKPLTRESALALGGEATDNSSSASFRIKKTQGKPERLPFIRPFQRDKFTRKKSGIYIEKNKHRIDTSGELKGITAKGWLANRLKAEQGRFFGSTKKSKSLSRRGKKNGFFKI